MKRPPGPQTMLRYINGKFTAQRTTGVQRVASELVKALDVQLHGRPGRWVLLCPPGTTPPRLSCIEVRHTGSAGLPLHLWEQVQLPWAARGGLLISLAGSAPYFARRQVALLHDAAVFDQPEAYTAAFIAWYRLLFRRLARCAERLLTVSFFSQARLALRLRVAPERLTVLHNGCDHLDSVVPDDSVLARHGLHGKRFLLAVASDNPSKNLPALMAAFAQRETAAANVRLVIVGGRNQRVFAERSDAADPPGVVRVGPVGDAQLKALYRDAVALLFPSLYEGFGLPPLEAMACGCPVAAADAAALPEVCGDAALYFNPREVPAIAVAMQRLLVEPWQREQLIERGAARAAQFRWSLAADRLLAALPADAVAR